MSEATKIPEVLDTTSQRDTARLFSPMKRMKDGHQHHDGYLHSGFPDISEPGPLLTPFPVDGPYYTPPLQQYQTQLQKLRQLKEVNKNQESQASKRPRLQIPVAPEPGDTDSWRRMQERWEALAKDFDNDKVKDTPGTLYWKNRNPEATSKCKKDTQQPATNTETTGAETPATPPAKKDREEVIGLLIRELWNDIRKSVAEVSKLKDDKIADQQLQIEQLKAEAEKHRKKIKSLRAQRKNMERLESEIESVRSQIQYFKDQRKYHCECENCKDYESEEESQTD